MTINMITGIATFLLGVIYSWSAYSLPLATVGRQMGHIFFPLMVGGLLILFGIVLFTRELIAQKKGAVVKVRNGKSIGRVYTRMIGISTGAGILYAVLFYPLGYVLSTFIFLEIITTTLNGFKHWKMNTTVAIVFSVAVYFLFSNFLGITLPRIPILDI